jgi:hypothetical protein
LTGRSATQTFASMFQSYNRLMRGETAI